MLSGVSSESADPKQLNEGVTMGIPGPGFLPNPQSSHQGDNIQESEDLHRLRMIVREEVASIISEIQAEKDLKDVAAVASSKSISATMGFSGPGFGSNTPSQEKDQTSRKGPTAGLIRGPGF